MRTQSAPDAMLELPASKGTDGDGTSGRIVMFKPHSPARLDGRAGAAPAVRVLIADGQPLVRAGFRALLEPADASASSARRPPGRKRSRRRAGCALMSWSSTPCCRG